MNSIRKNKGCCEIFEQKKYFLWNDLIHLKLIRLIGIFYETILIVLMCNKTKRAKRYFSKIKLYTKVRHQLFISILKIIIIIMLCQISGFFQTVLFYI